MDKNWNAKAAVARLLAASAAALAIHRPVLGQSGCAVIKEVQLPSGWRENGGRVNVGSGGDDSITFGAEYWPEGSFGPTQYGFITVFPLTGSVSTEVFYTPPNHSPPDCGGVTQYYNCATAVAGSGGPYGSSFNIDPVTRQALILDGTIAPESSFCGPDDGTCYRCQVVCAKSETVRLLRPVVSASLGVPNTEGFEYRQVSLPGAYEPRTIFAFRGPDMPRQIVRSNIQGIEQFNQLPGAPWIEQVLTPMDERSVPAMWTWGTEPTGLFTVSMGQLVRLQAPPVGGYLASGVTFRPTNFSATPDFPPATPVILATFWQPDNSLSTYRWIPVQGQDPSETPPQHIPSLDGMFVEYASTDGGFIAGSRWQAGDLYSSVWVWYPSIGAVLLKDLLRDDFGIDTTDISFDSVRGMSPLGEKKYVSAATGGGTEESWVVSADELVVTGYYNGEPRTWWVRISRPGQALNSTGPNTYDNDPGTGGWGNAQNWSSNAVPSGLGAFPVLSLPSAYTIDMGNERRMVSGMWVRSGNVTLLGRGPLADLGFDSMLRAEDGCASRPASIVIARDSGSFASLRLESDPPLTTDGGGPPPTRTRHMKIQAPYGVRLAPGAGATATLALDSWTSLDTSDPGSAPPFIASLKATGAGISAAAGENATAHVTVGQHALLATLDLSLADGPGSTATLTLLPGADCLVGGGGSAQTDEIPQIGSLVVGAQGTATATVSPGSSVRTASLELGEGPGSSGTLTLDGPTSVIDVTNLVTVGRSGTGILTLRNGGTLRFREGQTRKGIRVGYGSGGNGTMVVERLSILGNQPMQAADVFELDVGAGDNSVGNLLIDQGAQVTTFYLSMFRGDGSSGTVTLRGRDPSTSRPSLLSYADQTPSGGVDELGDIGLGGDGTLEVLEDAEFHGRGTLVVGPAAPHIRLDNGTFRLVSITDGLQVGPFIRGTLVIDGASPNRLASLHATGQSVISTEEAVLRRATVMIAGATQWNNEGDLRVEAGEPGRPNTLTVAAGAKVTTQTLSIAEGALVSVPRITVKPISSPPLPLRGEPLEGIVTGHLSIANAASLGNAEVIFEPGGNFGGTGLWPFGFTNNGVLTPGRFSNESLATDSFTIGGAYTQTGDGVLDVRAHPADFQQWVNLFRADQLVVNGPAQLDGVLRVSKVLGDPSSVAVGSKAVVLTAVSGFSGQFNSLVAPRLPGNLKFEMEHDYVLGEVRLVIVPAPPACAADFNSDGIVNTSDLVFLLVRFGQPAPAGSTSAQADFNNNGIIDTSDLVYFLVRFGGLCP